MQYRAGIIVSTAPCKNCVSHRHPRRRVGEGDAGGAGLPSFERARTAAGGWLLWAGEGGQYLPHQHRHLGFLRSYFHVKRTQYSSQ